VEVWQTSNLRRLRLGEEKKEERKKKEEEETTGQKYNGLPYSALGDHKKTVSGNVVGQSIAFRVVSIYWQGGDSFPLESWLKLTHPLLKAASFDTFCLVAPQP